MMQLIDGSNWDEITGGKLSGEQVAIQEMVEHFAEAMEEEIAGGWAFGDVISDVFGQASHECRCATDMEAAAVNELCKHWVFGPELNRWWKSLSLAAFAE